MTVANLSFPEYIRYPNWGMTEVGVWTRTAVSVDASGEYLCGVLAAPRDGDITKVHFFTDTNTVDGDIDIRIETVDDSTGNPSGTLWGANTSGTVTWTDSYERISAALTSAASVIQGDPIAVKLRANSSSIPTGGIGVYDQEIYSGFPYHVADIGTPIKNPYSASFWIEYSDGTTPNIPWHRRLFRSGAAPAVTNTTDYRYGIRFQLPFDAVISGAWLQVDFGSGSNALELYQSDGITVVETLTIDGNNVQSINNSQPTYHLFEEDFTATARTWYRLVYKTTSGSGAQHYKFGQPDLTDGGVFGGWDFIADERNHGLIIPVHYTETTSASDPTSEGDWTDTQTSIVPMAVLISEITEYSPDVTGAMGLS